MTIGIIFRWGSIDKDTGNKGSKDLGQGIQKVAQVGFYYIWGHGLAFKLAGATMQSGQSPGVMMRGALTLHYQRTQTSGLTVVQVMWRDVLKIWSGTGGAMEALKHNSDRAKSKFVLQERPFYTGMVPFMVWHILKWPKTQLALAKRR